MKYRKADQRETEWKSIRRKYYGDYEKDDVNAVEKRIREYKVKIEQFQGPLDLLLHLVGKARIDIEEIFVSKVTGQYLSYVASMGTLSMDRASEFLEMAAMLVYIKSRMILPANEYDETMEEDPELDLIARLKAYKVFKEASGTLKEYETDAIGA